MDQNDINNDDMYRATSSDDINAQISNKNGHNVRQSIELQKHVKRESNVGIIVYDDVELSSIKDSDTDGERMRKLIQKNLQKKDNIDEINQNSNHSSESGVDPFIPVINAAFKINVQVSQTETITLKTECKKDVRVLELKDIIMKELNKETINITLQYNDENMDDNKTLNDYNILDSHHIIMLKYNVQTSKVGNDTKLQYQLPNKTVCTLTAVDTTTIGLVRQIIRDDHKIGNNTEIKLYYMDKLLDYDNGTLGLYGILNSNDKIVVMYDSKLDVKVGSCLGIMLIMFIIVNIAIDINIIVWIDRDNKCQLISWFLFIVSVVKLVVIPIPILLVVCVNIRLANIKTYSAYLWLFVVFTSGICFGILLNESTPNQCTSVIVGIIWGSIHLPIAILMMIIVLVYHKHNKLYDEIRLIFKMLGKACIILFSIILDVFIIVAALTRVSWNVCSKIDGIIEQLLGFLLMGLCTKIAIHVVIPIANLDCLIGDISSMVAKATCFWFILIHGLIGIIIANTSNTPKGCQRSELNILLQIWSIYHFCLGIGIIMYCIRNWRYHIKHTIIGLCIFIHIYIAILTILGTFFAYPCAIDTLIYYGGNLTGQAFLQFLAIADLIFACLMVLMWSQTEYIEYYYTFIITIYGIISFIFGCLGANILNRNRIPTELCSESYSILIFNLNVCYHIILPILLFIIGIYNLQKRIHLKLTLLYIILLLYIGLFIMSIFAWNTSVKSPNYKCLKGSTFMGFPINIRLFLNTGARVSFGIYIVLAVLGIWVFAVIDRDESKFTYQILLILSGLFVVIWCFIGLIEYFGKSLSIQCKNSDLGVMMFGWSLINIVFYAIIVCIVIYLRKLF